MTIDDLRQRAEVARHERQDGLISLTVAEADELIAIFDNLQDRLEDARESISRIS